MLDFCTPYSLPKCCCIFSICWFCPLLFTFKVFEKSSLVGLEIPVVLKLFYPVVILFYFGGFCSYSLFQFSHYQCKPFSFLAHAFDLASLFLFSLIFFHLPGNYGSILLRYFLNLLISVRILHFQKGSFCILCI